MYELCTSVWVLSPFFPVLVPVVLGEGEAHLTDMGLGRGHLGFGDLELTNMLFLF